MTSQKNDDFYRSLRKKIQDFLQEKGKGFKYADHLLVAPDLFHLMCKLALDPRVTVPSKAALAGAIAYFVSPIDLIPEVLVGPIGYVDDVAVAAVVLNKIINHGGGEVAREHWAGHGDLLEVIQEIIKVADNMVGSGLWTKIRSGFS